jgi:hypothetical protein
VRVIVSIDRSRKSGLTGTKPKPQLPSTTDVGIPSNLRIVVRVQIDEAGRDDHTAGVDGSLRETGSAASHLRDLAVLDPNVGAVSRHAGAINNGSTFDMKI